MCSLFPLNKAWTWQFSCRVFQKKESSLIDFGGLDDDTIKRLTVMFSVEHVLSVKLIKVNIEDQV